MYECRWTECEKTFTKSCNRNRHEGKEHPGEFVIPEKEPLVCPNTWCQKAQKVYDRKYNLTRHVEKCLPQDAKTYLCTHDGCNASFDKPSKLQRHSSTHNKTLYTCDHCEESYVRKDKYEIHLLNHTMQDDVGEQFDDVGEQFDDVGEQFDDVGEQFDNDDSMYDYTVVEQRVEDETIDQLDNEMFEEFVDLSHHSSNSFEVPQCSSIDPFIVLTPNDISHTTSHPTTTHPVLMNEDEEMQETPPVYVLEEENNTGYFDDVYTPTQELDYESEITSCTLKHLRLLKHQGKRSSVKLQEFSKLCMLLFTNKFHDLEFMNILSDDLGFSDAQEFLDFINTERSTLKRGRPLSGVVERQLMYDFWVKNSEVSNDRRNARHVVKMKPSKLDIAVTDLLDCNIENCQTKGGKKYKAQRHIYSLTVRELYSNFSKQHHDLKCSSTLFYRCKPFYISPASDREMEGCLCAKCLNPHSLYNTLRRYMKDLPLSLSEYLTTFFECSKDHDLNFHKIDCINGCCKNKCKIIDESKKDYDWTKRVSYYQFEPTMESYHNKKGELAYYKRTTRKDYHDVLLKDAYNLLLESAREYLVHRYHTILDKVYWQRHLAETDSPVVWMDYSQNIKLVEKNQAQSAHFSGKQQTLHDTLIQYPGNIFQYVYHLSDDTNHDSVMTNQIVEEIITNHPEIIQSGKLLLRSDNCSTQYKSRFVFKCLLKLAQKYNIQIDFFYGEAGHGRGLIDAMAWFGCKGPMRKSIVTADKWYKNAEQMVTFLKEHFQNDLKQNKEYHLIDEEVTAKLRKEGREERIVAGCKASHVISFHPDGHTVKKWPTVKDFMEGAGAEEDNSGDGAGDGDLEQEPEIEPEMTWVESLEHVDMYNLIEKNSFVAIRAEPGSFELFHLMKVEDKHIAMENMKDKSEQHCILQGEPYLVGKWFSFQKETKKFAQYKEARSTEEALIHIGEVFSTNIEVNEKHQIDILDYRMLACSAF